MKKNNNELDEKNKLIDIRVDELKGNFENLSNDQKRLLAYRKIIELSNQCIPTNEFSNNTEKLKSTDELLAIIKAANINASYLEFVLVHCMSEHNNDYKELYQESLISYNKILENYSLLAQELKINNSLEISHLFAYMLWNGYYSVTKNHVYKLQERMMLPGMHSFDVIKGKGVCLAYAELLHNYLTTCGKTSALLNCQIPTGKNKIIRGYTPNINRNFEINFINKMISGSTMFLLKGLVNKVGNHAVTLIEENDKKYIYDPTNLYILNVVNQNTATIINGTGNFNIKPFATLMLTPNSDPNHIFEKLFNDNIEPAYVNEDIVRSYEKILTLINCNMSLLDDAYDNIHSELEFINNQTNEIGGITKSLKRIRKK